MNIGYPPGTPSFRYTQYTHTYGRKRGRATYKYPFRLCNFVSRFLCSAALVAHNSVSIFLRLVSRDFPSSPRLLILGSPLGCAGAFLVTSSRSLLSRLLVILASGGRREPRGPLHRPLCNHGTHHLVSFVRGPCFLRGRCRCQTNVSSAVGRRTDRRRRHQKSFETVLQRTISASSAALIGLDLYPRCPSCHLCHSSSASRSRPCRRIASAHCGSRSSPALCLASPTRPYPMARGGSRCCVARDNALPSPRGPLVTHLWSRPPSPPRPAVLP